MPFCPDMCCVCFETIRPGEHAEDAEGRWDVHAGRCAVAAGIEQSVDSQEPA